MAVGKVGEDSSSMSACEGGFLQAPHLLCLRDVCLQGSWMNE